MQIVFSAKNTENWVLGKNSEVQYCFVGPKNIKQIMKNKIHSAFHAAFDTTMKTKTG